MTWKVFQKGDRAAERQAQRDKEDNDTLIILYEDFIQGTYNERPRNT